MVGNGQLYELRTTPQIMSGSSTIKPTPIKLTLGDGGTSTELIVRLVETTSTPSPHIQLLPNLFTPKHCEGVGRTDHHQTRSTSDTHRFQNETSIDEIGVKSDGYTTESKVAGLSWSDSFQKTPGKSG